MVANKPGHQGEREISRKTIAQGRPGVPAHLWLLPLCFFVAQGATGAAGTRLSLRPLMSEGGRYPAKLGHTCREIAKWWPLMFENSART